MQACRRAGVWRACVRTCMRAHVSGRDSAYRRTNRRAGLWSVAGVTSIDSTPPRRTADVGGGRGLAERREKASANTGTIVAETGAKSRGAARAFAAPLSRSSACPAGDGDGARTARATARARPPFTDVRDD